jgi:CheY-like chemotaxis protein
MRYSPLFGPDGATLAASQGATNDDGMSSRSSHVDVMVAPAPVRVLVVDDFAAQLRVIKRQLGVGFEVLTAASVDEAVALLAGGAAVDAVLSDLNMPERSGRELFAWVAAHQPALVARFAFITGAADADEGAALAASTRRPVFGKTLPQSELRAALTALAQGPGNSAR